MMSKIFMHSTKMSSLKGKGTFSHNQKVQISCFGAFSIDFLRFIQFISTKKRAVSDLKMRDQSVSPQFYDVTHVAI